MAYKRSHADVDATREWKKFIASGAHLFEAAKVPLFLQESKARFDHWLMHGYHPEDRSDYCLRNLAPEARASLLELVDAYFAAGFSDPGIIIFSNAELARLANRPPFIEHMHSLRSDVSKSKNRNRRQR